MKKHRCRAEDCRAPAVVIVGLCEKHKPSFPPLKPHEKLPQYVSRAVFDKAIKYMQDELRESSKVWEQQCEELRVLIARYQGALLWCSGSSDFSPEGQAFEGWKSLCVPLMKPPDKTGDFLPQSKDFTRCSTCTRNLPPILGHISRGPCPTCGGLGFVLKQTQTP